MLKDVRNETAGGEDSEAAPEQKYETPKEKHPIKLCPATLGVSLCLISCILSAWKQTAAAPARIVLAVRVPPRGP